MTEVNVPLLRKSVEWVEEQEALPWIDREWWQGDYYIDSDFWAMILVSLGGSGMYQTVGEQRQAAAMVAPHCGSAYCVAGKIAADLDERYVTTSVVDDVHAADVARKALGLTEYQANRLFSGGNKAADIRQIAENIAGQKL